MAMLTAGCAGRLDGGAPGLATPPIQAAPEPSKEPPISAMDPNAPPIDVPQVTLPSEPDPNAADHASLFDCKTPNAPEFGPRRMWRVTGNQYEKSVRSVTGSKSSGFVSSAVAALKGTAGETYSNVASIAGMDFATLDAILNAASLETRNWMDSFDKKREQHIACLRSPSGVSTDCLKDFVQKTLAMGFRRPPSTEEVDSYTRRLWPVAQSKGGAEAARVGMMLMLSSPELLFRSELGEATTQGFHRLTPWEVADALSFTLADGPPDRELANAAAANKLSTAAEVGAQVERLFALNPSFSVRFIAEMTKHGRAVYVTKSKEDLNPMKLPNVESDPAKLVNATNARVELLSTQPSFLDNWLLGTKGTDTDRAGFLTERSFLWAYSQPDSTDPIRRGKFISTQLLCNQLPAIELSDIPDFNPAPNATMRQRLQQHNSEAACVQCHKMLDGIGLGLERFDGVGLWRDTEQGAPIDTTGVLLGSGTEDGPFNGPVELSEKLARSQRVRQCFVRQAFRFTTGRNESTGDACTLTSASTAFARQGQLVELIKAYFTSELFFHRR
jgi:hypothetical protein